MFCGDDARGEPLPENGLGLRQVRLPEKAVPSHQRIVPSHAVDDDVDSVVGAADPAKQRFHLRLVRVIDAQRDRDAAGGRDQRRGLVDGLGPLVRRWFAFDTAAGAVDRRTRFSERAGDATPRAAGRSGDETDASGQWLS